MDQVPQSIRLQRSTPSMNRVVKAVRGLYDVAFDAVVGWSRFGERRTTL